MAGLTHHFLLNPLVGQPFLGSEGEDGHDKIKAKRYGSGSGWSALYDSLESILALRSNAGCRPSERQKIEAVSDVLITNGNIGEADNDEMAKVAASYWQLHPEVDDTPASAAMVKESVEICTATSWLPSKDRGRSYSHVMAVMVLMSHWRCPRHALTWLQDERVAN